MAPMISLPTFSLLACAALALLVAASIPSFDPPMIADVEPAPVFSYPADPGDD